MRNVKKCSKDISLETILEIFYKKEKILILLSTFYIFL